MQDGEGIDLLHDVVDGMAGAPRPSPCCTAPVGHQGDFLQLPVLEDRQDVAVDDVLAHRPVLSAMRASASQRAVISPRSWRPSAAVWPAARAPGKALIDRPLGVEQSLARHGQRHAGRPVPSERERLAAPAETVVVAEGDGADGRYRHVHAIAVKTL